MANIPLCVCVCVYTPHLYLFLWCWTFWLLPYPFYWKQCCNEHWGANIFLNYDFLWVYAQEWDFWVKW